MAVKSKKGKTVDKWRKKKFFSVLAPKMFQERELGQAMAYEPSLLQDRRLNTNLMVLTGNIKKQDINVTFRVVKVQGDTAFTRLDKYEISPAALKRRVRRQRDRLDDSFQCVTKDNKIIRIKPLILTRVKTSKSVKTAFRKAMLQHMINSIRNYEYDALVMDIINDRLQKEMSHKLSKIVPIRFVNIRVLQYLGEQKSATEPVTEAPKKEEEKKVVAEPAPKTKAPVEA